MKIGNDGLRGHRIKAQNQLRHAVNNLRLAGEKDAAYLIARITDTFIYGYVYEPEARRAYEEFVASLEDSIKRRERQRGQGSGVRKETQQ